MPEKINVGVIGTGNWGRNIVRTMAANERANVKWLCDISGDALKAAAPLCEAAQPTAMYQKVLEDPDVHAVMIATDPSSHFEIAKAALEAGKYVFVEKPMTTNSHDARKLVKLAGDPPKLMVGHLMLCHGSIISSIHSYFCDDDDGLRYLRCERLNAGIVRKTENAWWSLAPHDISVACYLFQDEPVAVSAVGQCFLQEGVEDVVQATVQFAKGQVAFITVSWIEHEKIRKITAVGDSYSIVLDDTRDWVDKTVVYPEKNHALCVEYRPPLDAECGIFLDNIGRGWSWGFGLNPLDGLRVVKVLEAGQKSLTMDGVPIRIRKGPL